MALRKHWRELRKRLARLGVRASITPTRRHLQIWVEYGGRRKLFYASSTPKDDAYRETVAEVRRWISEI